jgi:hypothetical protein
MFMTKGTAATLTNDIGSLNSFTSARRRNLCRLACLAAAFLSASLATTGTAGAFAAAPPVYQNALADPYAYTPAELAADGISTYPLSGTRPLPDGGTSYDYDLPDGSVFSIRVPPPGFDPLQATTAELAAYSIPSPPQGNPNAYAAWVSNWSQIGEMDFPVPPFVTNATVVLHGINRNIWSGRIAEGSQNSFDGASADWTQPHVDTSYCDRPNSAHFVSDRPRRCGNEWKYARSRRHRN